MEIDGSITLEDPHPSVVIIMVHLGPCSNFSRPSDFHEPSSIQNEDTISTSQLTYPNPYRRIRSSCETTSLSSLDHADCTFTKLV